MVQYKDVPDYYFKKALALEKLGKYEESIECYDKILEIDPRALNAYHNKGVALEKLGKHEEAVKCFDKEKPKEKISPEKEAQIKHEEGFELLKSGKYEEAVECFGWALVYSSYQFASAYAGKGAALLALTDDNSNYEDYEVVIDCLDSALRIEPNDS